MDKLLICFALTAIAMVGCQTKAKMSSFDRLPSYDGLPLIVGGASIECLVFEKKGAPVLEINIDEIVLSNGCVKVAGRFSGFPERRLTLHTSFFNGTLASVILSSPKIEKPFRLVADDEFVVATPAPVNWVFESSTLFAGGKGQPVGFSHSYKGFPSDAQIWEDKAKMNIIHRFDEMCNVSYFLRTVVVGRFSDQSYEYPNDEWSWINIKGEGNCMLRVYKDDL